MNLSFLYIFFMHLAHWNVDRYKNQANGDYSPFLDGRNDVCVNPMLCVRYWQISLKKY